MTKFDFMTIHSPNKSSDSQNTNDISPINRNLLSKVIAIREIVVNVINVT